MAKLGMSKKNIHESVHDETVEHRHVPGRAYEVENPAQKLIHIIGGGFFNEPRYYDSNRSYEEFANELRKQDKINSRILDKMGLTEQAREVIETMNAVATGDNPEDLLIIAAWARDKKHGLKLRTTPQIALVVSAYYSHMQQFVHRYATAIMDRADEIKQVFAAYRHLFQQDKNGLHKGRLPKGLKRGLAEALAHTSLYNLLKYNSDERPTFKDVLLMVSGSKNIRKNPYQVSSEYGYPLSKPVFEYLVNGKVMDDAPDMIKVRKKFFGLKKLEDVTDDMWETAGLTWENIVSQFGSKKEVWEKCIPLMGEMALTRNLRNFEQAGISKKAWDLVYEKCGNIVDTVQLPFRFFTALKQVSSTEGQSLVAQQLDKACQNVPELPGVTVIVTDNSGSARYCCVSGKSDIRVADAGDTLGAVIAKRMGRNAIVGVFGDRLTWVKFNQADSCLTIKDKIDKAGARVGQGTESGLWEAIHDLTNRKVHVDRWIIVSDMCCYTLGNIGYSSWGGRFGCGGDKATIQSLLDKYRQGVNKDCYIYSVNLNGHGQAQVRPKGKNVHLMSGWSEQIFGIMRDIEGYDTKHKQAQAEPVEIPTLEVLRKRYKR